MFSFKGRGGGATMFRKCSCGVGWRWKQGWGSRTLVMGGNGMGTTMSGGRVVLALLQKIWWDGEKNWGRRTSKGWVGKSKGWGWLLSSPSQVGTLHCIGSSDSRNEYTVSDHPSSRGPLNPRIRYQIWNNALPVIIGLQYIRDWPPGTKSGNEKCRILINAGY